MENEQEERKKIQNHVMNDAIFHQQKKYEYDPQEHFDPPQYRTYGHICV